MRTCQYCDKPFTPKTGGNQNYCSHTCVANADSDHSSKVLFNENKQQSPSKSLPSPIMTETNDLTSFLKVQLATDRAHYEKLLAEKTDQLDSLKEQYIAEVNANRELRVKVDTLTDKHKYETEHLTRSNELAISAASKAGLNGLTLEKTLSGLKEILNPLLGQEGLPGIIRAWKGMPGTMGAESATDDMTAGLEGISPEFKESLQNLINILSSGQIENTDVVINGAIQLAFLAKINPQKLSDTVSLLIQEVNNPANKPQ